jgi:amino-acid N-acetyltransferase
MTVELELETEAGREVCSNLVVRKARISDILPILRLINGYAAKGIMLARTEFEMSENIRDFTVAYSGGELLGCGALHFYTPTTAEVRSLAVEPRMKKLGIGRIVVEALEQEARENELHAIFAFTYVPGFFSHMGFMEVDRGSLPLKAWKDCLRCPKFQCCDEIAVLKALCDDPVLDIPARLTNLLVELPQVRR